ncbi:hypothetical protein Ddye_021888 [Dipteronia dyeriana]|uniref:Two-component response regulator n=1 Tax=Dipteronia dyeriana TaxID=168575 RepID=A0AAD9U331_9ROSI|nr:hypothetical protein Ddye_021888 [Dipteronia dyeriana]
MAVEDKRAGEDGAIDRFPIGMRVLAVDDDPICLKVLENLLRKCQYEVTITNQAAMALNMLRENRNKYDLVISDVNMPDIDGFKLLELVGLEMDLPVIMLSAYSDTKLVMKGITHGACDYLLKPVRIEELKNIWQHVIRKKKIEPKNQNKSPNQEKGHVAAGEGGQMVMSTGNSDHSGKFGRKRKDQDEDDDEEAEEDGNENEESTSQKKPRVVWSIDLHKQFVAAVNQLGFEKAVPKKILDLMNVEWLSRENVASHLQKYRLYLKRISQQPNMVATLGGQDPSFMHMAAVDGFGDFRSLSSPGRLSSTSMSTYQPGGMFGRLNSTAGLTIRGIASSGMIQSGHSQTLRNSYNALGKLQNAMLPANQGQKNFNGVQASLELNQLPQSKSSSHIGEFHQINDPTAFTPVTNFADARATPGTSTSSLSSSSSNPLMLQANLQQQAQSRGAFGNQSSLGMVSLNPGTFDMGVSGSYNFLDYSRRNESCQGAGQLSKFPSNSLPLSEPFSHNQLSHTHLSGNLPCQIGNNLLDHSSSMALPIPMEDSKGDMQCQATGISNVIQNMNFIHNLSHSFSNVNSLVSGKCDIGPFRQNMDQTSTVSNKTMDVSLKDQYNGSSPYLAQHAGVEKSSLDTKMKSNDDYLFEQSKSQDGFSQNNYESLDDIMSTMMKRDQNDALLGDGEFKFDDYTLGSYM